MGAAKGAGSGPPRSAPAGGLYAIAITLTTAGEVHHLEAFLNNLQYVGNRRVLISSVQLAPSANAKTVSISQSASATIQLAVFVAPQSAADQASADQAWHELTDGDGQTPRGAAYRTGLAPARCALAGCPQCG